ncbi:MAG TPA: recombinase family protein [Polyangia bacterium]
MTETTTCALYIRVSSDGQSLDNQKPELHQLARVRGLAVTQVFEEKVSAVKHRPAYEAMMRAAHQGQFQALVIWALDRLGRSMIGNLTVVLELDRLGVQVISVRESWLDTASPVRPLLLAVFSWVAEQERRRISERTKAGLDRARRHGRHLGRPRVAVSVSAALALRRSGLSIREVARQLKVGASTLHRLLQAAEDAETAVPQTGTATAG